MSVPKFEMVIVEEEGRDLKPEMGFPLLPELCQETVDDYPLLMDELDIKEEPFSDIDEMTETASEQGSLSPSIPDTEQADGADNHSYFEESEEPEVPLQMELPLESQQIPLQMELSLERQQIPLQMELPVESQQIPLQMELPLGPRQIPLQTELSLERQQIPLQMELPLERQQIQLEPQQILLKPDVPLKDPVLANKNKSVFYSGTRHLEKPPQQDNKLRIVRIQSSFKKDAYRPLNVKGMKITVKQVESLNQPTQSVESILSSLPSVSVHDFIPNNNIVPALTPLTLPTSNPSNSTNVPQFIPNNLPVVNQNPPISHQFRIPIKNTQNLLQMKPSTSILKFKVPGKTQKNIVVQNKKGIVMCKNINFTTITGKNAFTTNKPNSQHLIIDYNCIKCKKKYDNPLLLMYHDCTYPNSRFHCKMCPRRLINSKDLQDHIVNRHLTLDIIDGKPDFPILCLKKVEEWYTGKIYSPKPHFTCDVCQYVTKTKKLLKNHIKSHFKLIAHKCKLCIKKFKTNFSFKMHLKNFHKIESLKNISIKKITSKKSIEKEFHCSKCNINFKTELGYKSHLKLHRNISSEVISDENQQIEKPATINVNNSISSCTEQSNITNIVNSDNEPESNSVSQPMSDNSSHTHVKKPSIIFKLNCKYCGIFLMNESQLDLHLNISHKNEQAEMNEKTVETSDKKLTLNSGYPCNYCKEVYVHSFSLEYHVRTEHKRLYKALKSMHRKGQATRVYKNLRTMKPDRKLNVHTEKMLPLNNESVITAGTSVNKECQITHNLDNVSMGENSRTKLDNENMKNIVDDKKSDNPLSKKGRKQEIITVSTERDTDSNHQFSASQQLIENNELIEHEESELKNETHNKNKCVNKQQFTQQYICNLCNIYIDDFDVLYEHAQNVHKNNFIQPRTHLYKGTNKGKHHCDECDKIFISKKNLKHHKIRHRNIKPYPCMFCTGIMVFTDSTCMYAHYQKCHPIEWKSYLNRNNSLICNLCNINFNDFDILYEHAQNVHKNVFVSTYNYNLGRQTTQEGSYICDECAGKISFKTEKQLKHHKLAHRNIKPFKCLFCTETFTSRANLYIHNKDFHPKQYTSYINYKKFKKNNRKKKTVTYKLGNAQYVDKKNINNRKNKTVTYKVGDAQYVDVSKINPKNNLVFACHDCDLIFKSKSEIYSHCKNNHVSVKIDNSIHKRETKGHWKCDECNREFSRRRALEHHTFKHLNIRPYGCGFCGKMLASCTGLLAHKWICHEDDMLKDGKIKPAKYIKKSLQKLGCNICDKSNTALNNHKTCTRTVSTIVNKSEGSFCCNNCSKLFTTYEMLKKHIVNSACKKSDQTNESGSKMNEQQNRKRSFDSEEYENKKTSVETGGEESEKDQNLKHVQKKTKKCTAEHKFFCNICNEQFESMLKLYAHKILIHRVYMQQNKNGNYYDTYGCEKTTDEKQNEESDEDQHVEKKSKKVTEEQEFLCDICDEIFESKIKLYAHKILIHKVVITTINKSQIKKGPFYCDVCAEVFVKFSILKKHIINSSCKKDTTIIRETERPTFKMNLREKRRKEYRSMLEIDYEEVSFKSKPKTKEL